MKTSLLVLALLSATASAFADHTQFTKPAPSRAGGQVVRKAINHTSDTTANVPMDRGMGRYGLRRGRGITAATSPAQPIKESQFRPYRRGENHG